MVAVAGMERWFGWAMHRSGLFPTPLLHTFQAPLLAEAVLVANEVAIFDRLAEGELEADALARATGLDTGATLLLLRALEAGGYLRSRGGRYGLCRVSRRWLLSSSPRSLRDKLLFQRAEMRLFAELGAWLRSGRPAGLHTALRSWEWPPYQRAMRAFARRVAPQLVEACPPLADPRRMLDIGGAHGHFSAAFCRRYPRLCATVLDLPEAVRASAPLLAEEGLGARLAHRAGDARDADLGEGSLDLVLIGQLVHHLDGSDNRDLLARVGRALRPGGVVLIYDAIAAPGSTGAIEDLFGALSSGSRAWSEAEMAGWLAEAGLRVLPARRLPGGTHGVLAGRR